MIRTVNYRLEETRESLAGYKKRAKAINMRVFSFDLEYDVGYETNWTDRQVRTRYQDGSFTLLSIPSDAFEVVDMSTAGVYTVVWEDPITGEQTADITVR